MVVDFILGRQSTENQIINATTGMMENLSDLPLLSMQGVSKSFPGVKVLHGVDFKVYPNEVVALMGENGAGKSTLMKILCGVWPVESYEGQVFLSHSSTSTLRRAQFSDIRDAHRAGIAMIHQELSVFPELTVAEHLELDQLPQWIEWPKLFQRVQLFLDQTGFDLQADTRVGDLSIGGRQLVEIARALYRDARILIFDEPTSALTDQEVLRLYQIIDKLRADGKGIIYITHRFDEVFRLADRMVILRDGQFVGQASLWREDLGASPTRSRIPRKELEPQMITWMVGRDIRDIYPVKNTDRGPELLRVKDLSLTSAQGKYLVRNLNFTLKRGEVLGLGGLLGAGRSETFEALFGVLNCSGPRGNGYRTTGEVWLENKKIDVQTPRDAIAAKIAYVSEDRKGSGLVMGQSIRANMALPSLAANTGGLTHRQSLISLVRQNQEAFYVQKWAKELRIKASSLDQSTRELSGGNQQKIVLAKWLMTSPDILFLDEPTRGIDVGAKAEIYQWIQRLAARGIGILVASSEMPELLGICHRILVLREGQFSAEFDADQATQEDIMRAASL